MVRIVIYIFLVLTIYNCKNPIVKEALDAEIIHLANQKLLEISMEDIYSPPVATRVFAYPNIAAYEIYAHKYNYSAINKIAPNTIQNISSDSTQIDYSIASLMGYIHICKKVVFSEYLVDSFYTECRRKMSKAGISSDIIQSSENHGLMVAKQMSSWIDKDNYDIVKSDNFYTVKNSDSSWVLTPPSFDSALEPNWKNLRYLTIKNKTDFYPRRRPQFSSDKNSEFYQYAIEVYNISKQISEEQKNIALHWDCNPNEYNNIGHNTFFVHKISPPGHWVNITKPICKNNHASYLKTLESYALVTTAIFDGMIVCWDTKYTEELIRPVTYINRYIDPYWEPYIQTPPFPEYTSGHSTVSGAGSQVLDLLFTSTSFVDSTEVRFGLPSRHYKSILDAGQEASNSRLYGGIHYRFGVDNGLENGKIIGQHVFNAMHFNALK